MSASAASSRNGYGCAEDPICGAPTFKNLPGGRDKHVEARTVELGERPADRWSRDERELHGPRRKHGTVFSGWPQQLVSRIGVSDHTMIEPCCRPKILPRWCGYLMRGRRREHASAHKDGGS